MFLFNPEIAKSTARMSKKNNISDIFCNRQIKFHYMFVIFSAEYKAGKRLDFPIICPPG